MVTEPFGSNHANSPYKAVTLFCEGSTQMVFLRCATGGRQTITPTKTHKSRKRRMHLTLAPSSTGVMAATFRSFPHPCAHPAPKYNLFSEGSSITSYRHTIFSCLIAFNIAISFWVACIWIVVGSESRKAEAILGKWSFFPLPLQEEGKHAGRHRLKLPPD